MSGVKLTKAQRETLRVLAVVDGRVQGSRRRSTVTPRPNVNFNAAMALVRAGLARVHSEWPDGVTTHENRYSITDAGRAALASRMPGVRVDRGHA